MRVKAVFFDIDGTLVSFRTHRIPASTRDALFQLREKGIRTFVATGRSWMIIDNLEDCPFDGFITMNGSSCFTSEFEPIFQRSIPKDNIQRLIDSGLANRYIFEFASDHDMFITGINDRVLEITRLINLSTPRIAPLEEALESDYYEMMGYFTAEEAMEEQVFENVLPDCLPMRWHPLFTDIIVRGNSKSVGIDHVLAHYGIDLSESMAFGDGGNDIPMLQHVGVSVAMGNAEQKVKEVADYITTSVDDDGVLQALKHFNVL